MKDQSRYVVGTPFIQKLNYPPFFPRNSSNYNEGGDGFFLKSIDREIKVDVLSESIFRLVRGCHCRLD